MNGNRIIVYREFVGVTPVAKTLRNELRPIGHTQEHIIHNGLIPVSYTHLTLPTNSRV